ncbi:MAG: cbb3-type cytochrome c oxidase subunit 3 [Wenzhouxiangella sp.]|jgi:cbb3-type cytochrome oxidase subunit 3|nr:cbb3-type cytochrome c oxidase subunit 3 [Wenzhouxiangella sp.]
MTAGLVPLFAMLAFVAIAIWVFLIKDKKDFDEQAHMPLEEDTDSTEKKKESSS